MIDVNLIGAPAFAVAVRDGGFTYAAINRRLSDMIGIPPEDFVGYAPHDCLPVLVADHVTRNYSLCVLTREAVEFDDYYELPKGSSWWQTIVTPVFDADGVAIVSLIGVATDISARKEAERAKRDASARMALAMDIIEGGFWHLDIATSRLDVSPKLIQLVTGKARPSVTWDEYLTFLHPEDVELTDASALILGKSDQMVTEYRVIGPAGQVKWMQCKRRLVRDEFERPASIVGVVADITEQKRLHARLHRQATTDALTRLYNRRGFDQCAELCAVQAKASGTGYGIVVVDLDRFKPVNDRFGHAVGDGVLRQAAVRLLQQVRPADIVARFGGDEFAILVADADTAAIEAMARRIIAAMAEPFDTPAGPVTIGASAGCAFTRDPDLVVGDLLVRADRALYDIKDAGRGSFKIAA